ncbi:hypothetical protein P775_11185 [Puniceibacterium antarcticum]|uniref:Uncharacterized protein n=1 Tax=Puniceibacterium antarcticum TaxID=1206336 RepID=A0A2G8RFA4_9RHOB|nr:hypothetical protein [Puniceibacterium antarcticum]PIL20219.1 hypothetical protein P775_11185 [Puniceibacterium antarcticum]
MARYRDPLTKDLFAWEPPKVAVGYGSDVAGRGPLDNRIARLVARALRDARDDRNMSRADVAKVMSEFLGRSVSEAMLHKWSSEASTDHRLPLDAFVALVQATGAMELLGFVPGEFGLTVIETEYADVIEERLLDDHLEEMEARRQLLRSRRRSNR